MGALYGPSTVVAGDGKPVAPLARDGNSGMKLLRWDQSEGTGNKAFVDESSAFFLLPSHLQVMISRC